MKTNIAETAKVVMSQLDIDGFNGIDVVSRIESEEEWNEDYAIFIMDCDLEFEEGNDYVKIDSDRFWHDLKQYFQKQFGSDVEIKHYPACDEWEVMRKKI
jgi:hypothetical protein